MSDTGEPHKVPTGFKLRYVLRGHVGTIFRVAWSPDGFTLASAGRDGTSRLWDTVSGKMFRVFEKEGPSRVYDVAWSPNGTSLASGTRDGNIVIWDVETGSNEYLKPWLSPYDNSIFSVAWSPDGQQVASGCDDGSILVWDADDSAQDWSNQDKRLLRTIKTQPSAILSLLWSGDGKTLASGSEDGAIRVFDADSGRLRHKLDVHSGAIASIAWSPDGKMLASGGQDATIRLWDTDTNQLIMTLEGHTASVTSVAFSFNGALVASKSSDETVRLWSSDTGQNVAVLYEPTSGHWPPGLAFHPNKPVLATLGEHDSVIRIWDLNFADILAIPSVVRGVTYTNAKVVLVGETGVGKTALGMRLAEGLWEPTPGSTHGMNVWTLHSEPERDVMLWDFAGQDEYRLVHQLFLNETNVALLLYDSTKSNDTFIGIEYWEKALKNAVSNEVQKILVAARVDVGGVRMMQSEIDAYRKAHDYIAHFATSSQTNEGCNELRVAIMDAVPWGQLPRTSSPEVFKRIKNFLTSIRQGKRILVRESDLRAELGLQASEYGVPTEAEFRTVIRHVETAGLIKRLSFGDFVLLKPELLNGYASDVVDAARRHADGLGAVRKAEVLNGHIRLKDEGGLQRSDKIFLLHATVELFLRLGLALEQDGNLVFPSKFNRRMPPLEEDPLVEVEFDFEGAVENLYTTLVVKLYYGGIFRLKKLWKNAAEFLNARNRVCGFQLHSEGDGLGALKVFYAEGVSDDDKALFLKIIADHFKDKRVSVRRQRIYRCPHCGEPVRDRYAVEKAQERGATHMPCLYCFRNLPLLDALEVLYRDDEKFLTQIAEMEARAEVGMEREGELVAASAELRTASFKMWVGGADIATVGIVFTDVIGSTKLNIERGDEYWRQVRRAHFARAKKLVKREHGYLIKTIGDSVMAAFHSAGEAVDFAMALYRDPGYESLKIRAGINIGSVEISTGDAFGQHVSMAARVESKAKEGGIWVSAQTKQDIDILGAARHRKLKWTNHPNEELKDFPGKYTLWSVE